MSGKDTPNGRSPRVLFLLHVSMIGCGQGLCGEDSLVWSG